MYFEARTHISEPVADAAAAVALVYSGRLSSARVPVWERSTDGQLLALVADGHIDNPWLEVAFLNLATSEQYESFTFGWMTQEAAFSAVYAAERAPVPYRNVQLPLDGTGETASVWFSCSHCGESYRSTIAKQKHFDQDAGFGACPSCERFHQPLVSEPVV